MSTAQSPDQPDELIMLYENQTNTMKVLCVLDEYPPENHDFRVRECHVQIVPFSYDDFDPNNGPKKAEFRLTVFVSNDIQFQKTIEKTITQKQIDIIRRADDLKIGHPDDVNVDSLDPV